MKVNYIYNNEAIASVAFGHFISQIKQISFAKAVLVFPLILHEPTVKKLNSSSYKRSIEEFIVQYPDLLLNINPRFLDSLPLAINSFIILFETKVISVIKDQIFYNESSNFSPKNIGKRIERIMKANDSLSSLIKNENTSSLYLKLKIQL